MARAPSVGGSDRRQMIRSRGFDEEMHIADLGPSRLGSLRVEHGLFAGFGGGKLRQAEETNSANPSSRSRVTEEPAAAISARAEKRDTSAGRWAAPEMSSGDSMASRMAPGRFVAQAEEQQGRGGLGSGHHFHGYLGQGAEGPPGASHELGQIIAGHVFHHPAAASEGFAASRNSRKAENVIAQGARPDAARSRQIGGDDAAESAALVAAEKPGVIGRLEGENLAVGSEQRGDLAAAGAGLGGDHQLLRLVEVETGQAGEVEFRETASGRPSARMVPEPTISIGVLSAIAVRMASVSPVRSSGLSSVTSSKPRDLGEGQLATVDMHAAKLGAAMQHREHLARVEQALRIEGAFQALLMRESTSENMSAIRSRFSMPTPCSPVSTPPTLTQSRSISAPKASARSSSPAHWRRKGSEGGGCRRRRERHWRREVVFLARVSPCAEDVRQLLARDGAVHAEIVRRDAPDRRKGCLAAGPESQPLLLRVRDPHGLAPLSRAMALDPSIRWSTSAGGPSSSTMSKASTSSG